jgi:hypothetical protein
MVSSEEEIRNGANDRHKANFATLNAHFLG